MRTNRILVAFALSILIAPVYTGCKKGEGDPTISFRSRKDRLAGELTVAEFDRSTKITQKPATGPTITTEYSQVLASGNMTETFKIVEVSTCGSLVTEGQSSV